VYYICINKQTHTVMKILVSIILFLSFFSLSAQVNTDSIESIMIQLIRNERNTLGRTYLYTSERCKKVSKIHLDYTMKFLTGKTYSHDETIPFYSKKVLESPSDRYALFNKDSVSVEIADNFYQKVTTWSFTSEIMTGCYVSDINEPNINKTIAETLFNKFKKSPGHYYAMVKNTMGGQIYRCNFSIGYKEEMFNGYKLYRFDCVGIFDQSVYYGLEQNFYKKSKESNFYLD
jgi:hypothetical protein